MSEKRITTVNELVDQISDDPNFKKRVKQRLQGSQITRILFALRNRRGLTRHQIAGDLGWSQSRVSKFEHSEDDQLLLHDIARYCSAPGLTAENGFLQGGNAASRAKYHFLQLKNALDTLVALCKGDHAMESGLQRLLEQVTIAFAKTLADCLSRMEEVQRQPSAPPLVCQAVEEGAITPSADSGLGRRRRGETAPLCPRQNPQPSTAGTCSPAAWTSDMRTMGTRINCPHGEERRNVESALRCRALRPNSD